MEEREPTGAIETAPVADPVDDVWRLLALGDRAGVLDRLEATGADVSAGESLGAAVIESVRPAVLRMRDAAATAGAAGPGGPYGQAEDRLASADRLAGTGQAIDALRALWQALDLYERSLTVPATRIAAPVESQPPEPVDPPVTDRADSEPLPLPAAVVPRVEHPPSPRPPNPDPVAAAPPAEPPVVATPPASERPSDDEAILEALRRYDAAYEALDLRALLRVFPSLDDRQMAELRRTFEGLSAYEIEIHDVHIEAAADSATVLATVARRMTPIVGVPVANETGTEFQLQRAGSGWIIVAVTAR